MPGDQREEGQARATPSPETPAQAREPFLRPLLLNPNNYALRPSAAGHSQAQAKAPPNANGGRG